MKYCLLLIIALALVVAADATAMEKCLICHGKPDFSKRLETGEKVNLFVDTTTIHHSVHANRLCTDCHADAVAIPHAKGLDKVNCRRCHYTGNPVGAPEGQMYDEYAQSVHGQEVLSGSTKAPSCQQCHGGHDVMPTESPLSHMHKKNRSKVCGSCHVEIYATYRESVHGTALIRDSILDSPDCADCHGEHDIKRHDAPESHVSAEHVSQTCGHCHGPLGVAAKYGIKTDRTTTYEESFHGIAHHMENKTVANCASCHSYHDIRPQEDPKSSINTANIVQTCGQQGCHPEATPQFATGKIHVDPTKKEAGLVYYITKFFTILTVSTLAGLFVFIVLDLFRRARRTKQVGM